MRRLVLLAVVVVLALCLAPAAAAQGPSHERDTVTMTWEYPAGTACDFALRSVGTNKENYFLFGDPEDPYRIHYQSQQRNVHINLATGYTLTETATVAETFYPGTSVDKVTGVFWHLRDADGRLVVVHAGLMLVDYSGAVPIDVKVTPHEDPDFFNVLCPALGGAPA